MSVFKAVDMTERRAVVLIYTTSTYSLEQATKVNPDPPRDRPDPRRIWLTGGIYARFCLKPVWFCGASAVLWTSWSLPSANHLLQSLCSCKTMHRATVIASNPLRRKLNRLVCCAHCPRHQTIPVSGGLCLRAGG